MSGEDWLIARFDVLGGEGQEWSWAQPLMAKLDLNPSDFLAQVTISTGDGGPLLRLSQWVRDDAGAKVFDLNLQAPVTVPVIRPITAADLPPWLTPEEKTP